jgi:hypothetical protein
MATQEGLATFDLHNFPSLEVLQICTGAGLPTPHQAARFWITPRLRRLVLDCSHNDSQQGIVPFFDSTDIEWLDEFATHAALKRMHEEIGLREIEVLFPTEYKWSIERFQFEQAKELVERCGFNFIYPGTMMPPSSVDSSVDSIVDGSVDGGSQQSTLESNNMSE